jgi:hypothetical protein
LDRPPVAEISALARPEIDIGRAIGGEAGDRHRVDERLAVLPRIAVSRADLDGARRAGRANEAKLADSHIVAMWHLHGKIRAVHLDRGCGVDEAAIAVHPALPLKDHAIGQDERLADLVGQRRGGDDRRARAVAVEEVERPHDRAVIVARTRPRAEIVVGDEHLSRQALAGRCREIGRCHGLRKADISRAGRRCQFDDEPIACWRCS